MTSAGAGIQYRRYRAPRSHGQTLFDPPAGDVIPLARRNAALLQGWTMPWGESRADSRREILKLSAQYARQYRDLTPAQREASAECLWIATGHQPELFHPGVWYKNFVLDHCARSIRGVPLSLIIDNDLCGPSSIRVPTGSLAEPRLETVSYDQTESEIPFEERRILDPGLLASFGDRAAEAIRPFVVDPFVNDWWPEVVAAARCMDNLGLAIAQARHRCEAAWGAETWELPLSMACETTGFRCFLAHILGDLPRFHSIYNQCLDAYRAIHRIRSRAHPAPRLDVIDSWVEAPFWIWSARAPHRRRLFVRRKPDELELTDQAELTLSLALGGNGEADVDQFAQWSKRGIRLRPRALLTTMYVRLVLCDLFIHGIGGGKYDQLTDAIIEAFWGIRPPGFLVVSATAQLPSERVPVSAEQVSATARTLRDLEFNPDRHTDHPDAQRWVRTKQHWLASAQEHSPAERHAGIQQANAALQPFVSDLRQQLADQRDRLAAQLRADKLLGGREFAFCLFPPATLQALLLDKSGKHYKLIHH